MNENRVLIVAPGEKVLNPIARALCDEDCSVFTAGSGKQGLSVLSSYEIDLVISDESMREMTGLTFLKKVKVEYPTILTMMVTDYPDTDVNTIIEAINTAGIYKIILKPLNLEELRQTVRRGLHFRNTAAEGGLLVERVKAQDIIIMELERQNPGITKIDGYENGIGIIKL